MNGRETFATRLKEVRWQTGKNQKEFADMVQSTAATISAYENATKNPSLEIVTNIAKKCNVSIDWLCGLSDTMELNHKSIRTLADIIRICGKYSNPHIALNEVAENFSRKIEAFDEESEHMRSLIRDGMIDQELYDLWLEKTLNKYDMPITMGYDETVYNPFEE